MGYLGVLQLKFLDILCCYVSLFHDFSILIENQPSKDKVLETGKIKVRNGKTSSSSNKDS